MGLFLSGALCMFLVALVAHHSSVNNLGEAFKKLLNVAHEEAFELGKMQGRLEALAVISEETDEYVADRIREALET